MANDNPPPPYGPPWLSQSYVTYFEDAELRALDIVTQVLGDDRLTNAQRWRIIEYAGSRFAHPFFRESPGGALSGEGEK